MYLSPLTTLTRRGDYHGSARRRVCPSAIGEDLFLYLPRRFRIRNLVRMACGPLPLVSEQFDFFGTQHAAIFQNRALLRRESRGADRLASLVGTTLSVLIEASPEPQLYEGRSMGQAPEVDGMVFVRTDVGGTPPAIGQPTAVRITQALEYDLIGETL